jgi:sec-independent protein translocase protein TatB
MFGISFEELLLVALVALIVLGPERMPEAVRTLALWIGRLKRAIHAIRQEVEREIGADEIRRQLHNEHIMALERDLKQALTIKPEAGADSQLSASEAAAQPASTTQNAAGTSPTPP